jgi:hypothetical protein
LSDVQSEIASVLVYTKDRRQSQPPMPQELRMPAG